MIQERFTAVASTCGQASVSTGVAFRDTDKPVIQISTPRSGGTSLNEVNGCPIDFYVGSNSYTFGDDTGLSSYSIDVTVESDRVKIMVCSVLVFATESESISISLSFTKSVLFSSSRTWTVKFP